MKYSRVANQQFPPFIDQLKSELRLVLPGVNAHLPLAPEVRIDDLKKGQPPTDAMQSAVLIILYPNNDNLHTVVILRNIYDGAHSGQISLPGGKAEDLDIDFKNTALREAEEEIGIKRNDLEIIGQLSRFYVKPSNFIIHPYIAFSLHRPSFHPDPIEVRRIIEIDIFKEISNDKIITRSLTLKNGITVKAPGFIVGGEFMWGATAMIFSELIQILNNTAGKMY